MIPKNRLIFYAYQFVPITLLLVISLTLAHIVGNVIFNDIRANLISFMVTYYGLYWGMMRGVKNKHNYNDNTSGVATVLSTSTTLA